MLLYKFIKSIIMILQSDIAPGEVAGGFAMGAIIGLTPTFTIQNILIFFLILLLRVNIGAAILGIGIFGIIGLIVDPVSHALGYLLLVQIPALTPLWGSLYNIPIVPFTRYNNTVVLGSLVIALILFVPVYMAAKFFIVQYRARYRERVAKWKIVQLFKLTNFYSLYNKFK